MNICIYGASSAELEQIYYDKTEELGRMMAKRGHGLVFGGVAVVRLYLEEEHYVLMTGIQNENILLFDPYYWDKPFEQKDILMDDKHPREYNRIVPFKYFNQENKETIYALGPLEEREAVLIFNEKTRTVPEEVIEYFI